LAVVLAIVVVMSSLAGSNLNNLRGRYRMNAAAREFAKTVELTRVRAITENREYETARTGSRSTSARSTSSSDRASGRA
jgi:Tfp pilus assembly protein FimT